jgi:hypothetical protein
VNGETRKRFLAVLTGHAENEHPSLTLLCRRTLELLPLSGASIVLISQGHDQGLAGGFGTSALIGLDLEFTLGEGPGVDVCAEGKTVLVDDLQSDDGRWPQFSASALGSGVRSVCALPLQVGSIRLGVLSFYGDEPRSMPPARLTDALLIAELVTHLVLAAQSEAASESLAWALDISDYRAVVHQATGMISAQLNCPVEEALVRLRGHAFATGMPIDDVAEAVVSGTLRFEDP